MKSPFQLRLLVGAILATATLAWFARGMYAQPDPFGQPIDARPDLSLIDDTDLVGQKVDTESTFVIVERSGVSRLLLGDDLTKNYDQPNESVREFLPGPQWQTCVLPALLRDGWRVQSQLAMGDGACLLCLVK
jgi:hypothetical protein